MIRKPTGKELLSILSFICGCIGMIEFSYFWVLLPRTVVFGDQLFILACLGGIVGTYIGITICGDIFTHNFFTDEEIPNKNTSEL